MSNLNSLYARLGGEEGVIRLVKAYIEALKTLPGAQRLRSLYPEDLSKYELRMTEFLSTWLGGPALYQERHGMPMLRESHRSFAIDGEARDEWDALHGERPFARRSPTRSSASTSRAPSGAWRTASAPNERSRPSGGFSHLARCGSEVRVPLVLGLQDRHLDLKRIHDRR